MAYPEILRTALEKVEASRVRRMNEVFPRLSSEERMPLLQAFHPDYIEDAFRELRVGPNKGQSAPCELVDLLEGPPILGQDVIDVHTADITTDVLVIGGGGVALVRRY